MYSHLLHLEPTKKKAAFTKGSILGRWLNLYYYNKIKPKHSIPKVLYNPLIWTELLSTELNITKVEAFNFYKVLISYSEFYKHESWKPVAIEQGFSKILYEDEDNLFVYEGRIDLVVETDKGYTIVDHKTQAMTYSIYEFNNQCLGYLWGTNAIEFLYNYLVLTKTPQFHRAPHLFNQNQIDSWKEETIQWYFRIKQAMQSQTFLKNLTCESKFGKCDFTPLCEQPNEKVKLFLIQSNFQKRKQYRSW